MKPHYTALYVPTGSFRVRYDYVGDHLRGGVVHRARRVYAVGRTKRACVAGDRRAAPGGERADVHGNGGECHFRVRLVPSPVHARVSSLDHSRLVRG